MQIYAAGVCHPGKARDKNEDTCVLDHAILDPTGEKITSARYNITKSPLFSAVFDGMGGISAGEVASTLSADSARDTQCWVSFL